MIVRCVADCLINVIVRCLAQTFSFQLLKTRAEAEGGKGDNNNISNEGVMNADLDHLPGTREGSIAYQRWSDPVTG